MCKSFICVCMGEGNQPPWGWAQYFDHNCDNPSSNAGGGDGNYLTDLQNKLF